MNKYSCMKKVFLRRLSGAVLLSFMTTHQVYASIQYKTIGDLEIYNTPSASGVTLTMMLDTSGSMGMQSIQYNSVDSVCDDYNIRCLKARDRKIFSHVVKFTDAQGKAQGSPVTVLLQGCGENIANAKLDRMSRLKKALVEMLADGQALPESYKVGAGNFSAHGMHRSGMMVIPAKPLTEQHRRDLITYISSLTATGGTPSASAYAEAGAYMMGTSTLIDRVEHRDIVFIKGLASRYGRQWSLSLCSTPTPNGTPNIFDGKKWVSCGAFTPLSHYYNVANETNPKLLPTQLLGTYNVELVLDSRFRPTTINSTSNPASYIYYGHKINGYTSSSVYSGFGYSDDRTKKPDKKAYQSPLDGAGGSCDGYGIYFMTDGQPNGSDSRATAGMMAKSLNRNSFAPSNDLPTRGTDAGENSGWHYMGNYAKVLASGDNPVNKSIKTAALGFGSVFTKNANDKGKVVICNVIGEVDARNLCKLGELGGGLYSDIRS